MCTVISGLKSRAPTTPNINLLVRFEFLEIPKLKFNGIDNCGISGRMSGVMSLRLAVLGSGSGSNCQSIFNAIADGRLDA